MNTIYIVCNNLAMNQLRNSKFFSTEAKAQAYLRKIADNLRFGPGIDIMEDKKNVFAYTFGQDEKRRCYFVQEIRLDTE